VPSTNSGKGITWVASHASSPSSRSATVLLALPAVSSRLHGGPGSEAPAPSPPTSRQTRRTRPRDKRRVTLRTAPDAQDEDGASRINHTRLDWKPPGTASPRASRSRPRPDALDPQGLSRRPGSSPSPAGRSTRREPAAASCSTRRPAGARWVWGASSSVSDGIPCGIRQPDHPPRQGPLTPGRRYVVVRRNSRALLRPARPEKTWSRGPRQVLSKARSTASKSYLAWTSRVALLTIRSPGGLLSIRDTAFKRSATPTCPTGKIQGTRRPSRHQRRGRHPRPGPRGSALKVTARSTCPATQPRPGCPPARSSTTRAQKDAPAHADRAATSTSRRSPATSADRARGPPRIRALYGTAASRAQPRSTSKSRTWRWSTTFTSAPRLAGMAESDVTTRSNPREFQQNPITHCNILVRTAPASVGRSSHSVSRGEGNARAYSPSPVRSSTTLRSRFIHPAGRRAEPVRPVLRLQLPGAILVRARDAVAPDWHAECRRGATELRARCGRARDFDQYVVPMRSPPGRGPLRIISRPICS